MEALALSSTKPIMSDGKVDGYSVQRGTISVEGLAPTLV
jgi:hypothetical protein